MSDKKSNVKKRNWAFVLYPESAPANWGEILQQTGLQCAVSPLHDRDLDPTGEPKKPHYHIITCYSGPTSYNIVKGLTESLNAPIPQALEQIKGYYRYLTHKDNPDKAQYSDSDITSINGFSISDYVELTTSEKLRIQDEILDFIRDNDITEMADLGDCIDKIGNSEWKNMIRNQSTMYFNTYLRSRRYKRSEQNK